MSSTFSIALSALKAQSEAIDTTGNNLANLNTTGFKGSTVDFKDLFSEYLGIDTGFQYGLGVGAPISNQQFTQGAIQSSQAPLAAAIQGNGFFVVNTPANQQLYTRDGNFIVDSNGVLKTQTGERVQGWSADANGVINSNLQTGDIIMPTGAVLPAKATNNISIAANLNATTAATGTYAVPIQVVDSLGGTHSLTVTFTKTATNTWTYSSAIPAADGAITGGTGTINFNSDGTMPAATTPPTPIVITALTDGAQAMNINWDLFNASGAGAITQYGEASTASSSQNGTQAAQLTQVGIQQGGQVVASFSDGTQKVEAQLALASIQNPTSLQNVGNNNYATTTSTATPSVGVPQSGGRGQIMGGELEGSNVDMATEFTNLIVYQSGYQASSKVITTADQMNQDLLNLIH
ncbi:MAG TPA: flagellar hook protein FlgE [Bryobacteraceae bacterium]|nr:flagellar hook protein FlgE [Bryobacteraceae bacterium]